MPFPKVIDSTMLATWRECQAKFYRSYIQQIRPPGVSIDLVAGAAFARGIEVTRKEFFLNHRDQDSALALGIGALLKEFGDVEAPLGKENKGPIRVAGALEAYLDQYPLADSIQPWLMGGKPCIEFTFAIPVEVMNPDTGDPIVLAGRTDMIGDRSGSPWLIDEKTTGQLGDKWPRKWPLRAQFMQYSWAGREHGLNLAGCLIRGIGLYKNDYGFSEAICYFEDWKIDRWYEQTMRELREMVRVYKSGEYDFAFGDPCVAYSGCPFYFLCEKRNPEEWIPNYYEHHEWNPLAKVSE